MEGIMITHPICGVIHVCIMRLGGLAKTESGVVGNLFHIRPPSVLASSRHHVLSGAVFDGKGFCMRTATMKFCVRGMTIGSNTVVAQLPGSKGSAEVGGNCVSPTNRSPVNAHDGPPFGVTAKAALRGPSIMLEPSAKIPIAPVANTIPAVLGAVP